MPEWFYRIIFRIQGSLFRKHIEQDFDAEVQAHVAQMTEENVARGMPEAEARRAALLRFGGVAQIREAHRDRRGIPYLGEAIQDLRYAARLLRRSPGFALIAIITLAVGISLNTTVFTIYDSIALRLLPVRDPGTVVRLIRWYQDRSRQDQFAKQEYEYVRDHSRSFEGVAAATAPIAVATQTQSGGEAEVIRVQLVSGNYFGMVGVEPAIGRAFLPAEDGTPGAHPVAVLSHRYWTRRFLGDATVLGKSTLINGVAFTFIGIAPESFAGTGAPPMVPDLWIPAAMREQVEPKQDVRFQIVARRKPGVDERQVASEMAVVEKSLEAAGFTDRKVLQLSAKTATFFDQTGGGFEVFIWVIEALMLAVTSVLLIGSLNLVNLLLARAMSRQREIAVRRALGAGKRRIVQQLCTETALVGLLGGAAGFVLSLFSCRGLAATLEGMLAQYGTGAEYLFVDVRPSGNVFLYAFAISLVTGILVGLVPARRAAQADVASTLKEEFATLLGGRGRFRDVLIAVQIAVCLTLLVGAGLLGRGVQNASQVDPGFETSHLFALGMPDVASSNARAQQARLAEVIRKLRETPQIQSVAFTFEPPLMGTATGNFEPLGSRITIRSSESRSLFNLVSAEYFETAGIPIMRGRAFSQQEVEHDVPVVVISEKTAERFWPGEDPLGKGIKVYKGYRPERIAGRSYTVIGVAKSVRSANLSKVDPAYIYFTGSYADDSILLIRTPLTPDVAIPTVREALRSLDRSLATQMIMLNVETGPVRLQRLMTEAPAIVAAVLGALGLLLATVGIYGVVAYLVSQRTREIGVRVALGASRGAVLWLVFRQALKPVLWGIPFGLAGSAMVSVLLSKMVVETQSPDLLFGVNPWSPVTFGGVGVSVVLVVWVASWLPARRAMRIEPATSLRYE